MCVYGGQCSLDPGSGSSSLRRDVKRPLAVWARPIGDDTELLYSTYRESKSVWLDWQFVDRRDNDAQEMDPILLGIGAEAMLAYGVV